MKNNRRMSAFMLAMILAFSSLPANAQDTLAFVNVPEMIRPGKLALINFTSQSAMTLTLYLLQNEMAVELLPDYPANEGLNSLSWDGTVNGIPVLPGTYQLWLNGESADAYANIIIGQESPALSNIYPSDPQLIPGISWSMHVNANMQGTLTMQLDGFDTTIFEGAVSAGETSIPWDGTNAGTALPPGEYDLILKLTDATGFASTAQHVHIILTDTADEAEPTVTATPAYETAVSPSSYSATPSSGELNYWTLPMDITNEAAIWEVMMQPITVLKGDQKKSYKLRGQPNDDAEAVGEITYDSQGVRVLENLDNGWSLVETYSSSFHDSTVKVYGDMVQGYVKTNLLQTKNTSKKYGLIIDKLTQRMYIFKDGKLFSELIISTGIVDVPGKYERETQAGDYILVSRVGKFMSDNLHCDMAIRFNNGNLIHQVPYTLRADGSKYFDNTEPKLGTKASHGCIRVQRRKNPQGINMAWLWSNLELNTRVLIWEDYKGRQIPLPSEDKALFYNPEGGSYYHNDAHCMDVKEKFLPLTGFTYAQLEDDQFSSLTRCPACAPPMRESELKAINASYAN